jgi:predicted transcriptional regulator
LTTTSLKLPDDLKKRAANVAGQLGISTHAFMVTAIEQAARLPQATRVACRGQGSPA